MSFAFVSAYFVDQIAYLTWSINLELTMRKLSWNLWIKSLDISFNCWYYNRMFLFRDLFIKLLMGSNIFSIFLIIDWTSISFKSFDKFIVIIKHFAVIAKQIVIFIGCNLQSTSEGVNLFSLSELISVSFLN